MKRISKLNNNRGAGLVTVIILIAFLGTIGTLIAVLAYTSSEMKSSERIGREVFYNTETCMEEVRAGVQTAVSDSIKGSYSSVLGQYSYIKSDPSSDLEKEFDNAFKDEIFNWKGNYAKYDSTDSDTYTVTEGNDKQYLLVKTGEKTGTYNKAVLQAMIKEKLLGNPKIVTSTGENVYEISDDGETITLKGVKLSYTKLLRKRTIESDIVIKCPDLDLSGNNTVTNYIDNFAIVVGGELNYHASKAVTIDSGEKKSISFIKGNAYAGSVKCLGTDNELYIQNSKFIVGGDINTYSSENQDLSSLLVDSNSTLWAKNIIVKTNSKVSLLGSAFVANDLKLDCNGAKAYIKNNYTGFGASLDNASESSAIIANGKNTVLNMEKLTLTLAGTGFVTTSSNDISDSSGNVRTAESIASKNTQKIYLVPEEFIQCDVENDDGTTTAYEVKTNPEVFLKKYYSDMNKVHVSIKQTEKILGDKYPDDYGMKIKTIYRSYANQYIAYYFMEFEGDEHKTSQQYANEYFVDYFNAHPEEIEKYVKENLTVMAQVDAYTTRGSWTSTEDGEVILKQYKENYDPDTSGLADQYAKLCVTLSESKDPGSATNPFEFWVNETGTDAFDDSGDDNECYLNNLLVKYKTVYFYEGEGSTKAATALITSEPNFVLDMTATASDPVTGDSVDLSKIRIIIATGNVEITSSGSEDPVVFNGLLLVKGNVTISSNCVLNSKSQDVKDAYMAYLTNNKEYNNNYPDDKGTPPKKIYLKNFIAQKVSTSENYEENIVGDYWDIDGLVYYDRWESN